MPRTNGLSHTSFLLHIILSSPFLTLSGRPPDGLHPRHSIHVTVTLVFVALIVFFLPSTLSWLLTRHSTSISHVVYRISFNFSTHISSPGHLTALLCLSLNLPTRSVLGNARHLTCTLSPACCEGFHTPLRQLLFFLLLALLSITSLPVTPLSLPTFLYLTFPSLFSSLSS